MKRWICGLLLICLLAAGTAGCQNTEQKRGGSEVEFTVTAPEEIPKELAAEIERNRKDEIRMAYADGAEMYLVRGYGEQKTGGYSIAVTGCTEDETAVYLDTQLIGPANQDQIAQEPSYPCIVLKIEARDKEIKIQ